MKNDGTKLLEALFDFESSATRRNPPRSRRAEYLSFTQARGIDLQSFSQEAWDSVAEAMGLSENERRDFLEEVAGWL